MWDELVPSPSETPDRTPALRLVVPRYGAAVGGGTESLARRLAVSLVAAGWRVSVLTSSAVDERTWAPAMPAGDSVEEGVLVRRFPVSWVRRPRAFHALSRLLLALPPGRRPERLWVSAQGPLLPGLVRALATEPPQPTWFSPYLYHPILEGLPVTRGPRLLLPAAHDEPWLRLGAVARMLTAVDALVYGTPEERALLERIHPAVRDLPWEVGSVGVEAPPDVDPRRFTGPRSLNAPYLLYAGRAGAGKGSDLLLAGHRHLRTERADVDLVLLGEAGNALPAEPGLRRVGWVDDVERWDALAGATAVVVPSRLESLGLLVLEAWAVGTPVLVNAGSEVLSAQVARAGGGLTFGSPAEFAAAALRLLDDPAGARALGTAGRDYVGRHHRWQDVHARLLRLVAAARARRPGAAEGGR